MESSSIALQCKMYGQRLTVGRKLMSSSYPKMRRNVMSVSCVKAPEVGATAKSDAADGAVEKTRPRTATFPSGFEALMLEVCDETEVAELKLKVGDFEMHLRRNVGATKAPLSHISPIEPPPIPTKPMDVPATVAAPLSPPKPSSEKATPFTNVSFGKSAKLAALEASGATGYVLVASPTVGSFRRNRSVKGKRQPPIFKEGDLIKEGQVIGYLDQFGTELPVKSDVAGEVLKLLFDDGDAVGYGDPLVAVLPSFHGIK
ncbi:biotin carboxyl carrier protein of acetyl-CoA carboxylase [Ricinus communis]|uniref:biotin carboxyl carrier protein of acetyl-CoA carboxylase n=1 Tax=Ricinus communis TaxID=3988 RepID=UPI00201A45E1|nr:biotin carboxyl carrier protein of acetyl-CoA carboxylase [Ricinus communis]